MKMSTLEKDGTPVRLRNGTSDWQAIEDVVQDVTDLALLRCVNSLLGNEDLLAEVAHRSHRHQLGFFKYVLMVDEAGGCLRVHLWDSDSTVQEDIHSHCARFQSRVVFGKLSENSFELVPGASHARFRYRFDTKAGHSVAVADGLTGVALRESRVLLAGDTYYKDMMELHNVSDAAPGTLTVSAWDIRQNEALVLKGLGACPEDCLAPVGISVEDLRSALHYIKERIKSK